MLIIAVASAPVEQYVLRMINNGLIVIPTLIVWVEPYAIAGHGILLNKPMDVFAELFDRQTLEYRYGVLERPEQYSMREAGCQSSYMPYSAFLVREMVYRIIGSCIKVMFCILVVLVLYLCLLLEQKPPLCAKTRLKR